MLISNATCQPSACHALLNLYIEVVPDISTDGTTTSLYPSQSRCPTSPPPNPLPTGTPQKERALSLLIDAFSGSAITRSAGQAERKGKLHFLATVFANVSGVGIQACRCFHAHDILAARRPGVPAFPSCDVASSRMPERRNSIGVTDSVH
jgi:hypothetical protein